MGFRLAPIWALLLLLAAPGHCSPRSDSPAPVTAAFQPVVSHRNDTLLRERAITTELSTCGYFNGDPKRPRTANDGYNCRVDTRNGLWGFCPTTVITASDCGLAGSCFDSNRCSKGCGLTERADLTTFTCRDDFCSIAILTFGVDQTYSYIACGARAVTEHYLVSPTAAEVETTPTISDTPSTSTSTSTVSSETQDPSTKVPPESSSAAPSQSEAGGSSTSTDSPESTQPRVDSPAATAGGTSQEPSGGSDTPIGAIIGGVLGGIALVCGTTIAVVFLLRRRNGRAASINKGPPITQHYEPSMMDWNNQNKHHAMGGWGPQELPPSHPNAPRSPVEMAG